MTNSMNKTSIENDITNLTNNLDNLNKKNTSYNLSLKEKENEYDRLLNKIEIIKNNIYENSYLNNNVKRVLENSKLKALDALINLIKINPKYNTVLEVATSSNKNFLVVETKSDASKIIDYLKLNNLGRITFLPLEDIKGKYVDLDTQSKLTDLTGYLGVLSDFLEYDSKYKEIILNQFGNILVVDTKENANYLSKVINNRYRIITLDGEIFHVGGSITGGSLKTGGITLAKQELTDLNLDSNNLKNTILTLRENINNNLKEKEVLENNLYLKKRNLLLLTDELKALQERLSNNKEELSNLKIELDSYDSKTFDQELLKLNQEYYDLSLKYELLVKDKNEFIKEYDNIQTNILEKEGLLKENNLLLKTKEKEVHDLEILTNKLENKLDNNLNTLNQDYNLTYEGAKEKYYLDKDLDLAKEEVLDLKNKLKNIGNVNLDSIEEYKAVKERYDFLTNERNDLCHAKEMLYSLISEMDDVMQSDFLTTFKELEIEFKKVFRELFKGGDASLKLTDPTNLMKTGVDIIACPPGKKLKTITLLSGGEKTLTAISLLFAILNIRMVPFCIFDEVEAALDEANVDNFGSYLHSYKNKTQFLLITHKKRTMEYAKTLYGITMQESGVSKIVSVKLEDNKIN